MKDFDLEIFLFMSLMLLFFFLTINTCDNSQNLKPRRKHHPYVQYMIDKQRYEDALIEGNTNVQAPTSAPMVVSRNAFTDILCAKDTVFTTVDNSIACLRNPDTGACFTKSELVSNSVPCKPSEFSAEIVKGLRDINNPIRKNIFPKVQNWTLEKCTANGLNDPNHWCSKTYNNLLESCVPTQLGTLQPGQPIPTLPAGNWCNNNDKIKITANGDRSGPQTVLLNMTNPTQRDCVPACTSNIQRIKDPKNPKKITVIRKTQAQCEQECLATSLNVAAGGSPGNGT